MTKIDTNGVIELSVAKLREWCDPFVDYCWCGLDRPITREEVGEAIKNDNLVPLVNFDFGKDNDDREHHVARIAWFVVHGWEEPLGIDVGVPSMGCCIAWPVIDGNHRWAAAIYRDDHTIRAEASGAVDEIEKLMKNNF